MDGRRGLACPVSVKDVEGGRWAPWARVCVTIYESCETRQACTRVCMALRALSCRRWRHSPPLHVQVPLPLNEEEGVCYPCKLDAF